MHLLRVIPRIVTAASVFLPCIVFFIGKNCVASSAEASSPQISAESRLAAEEIVEDNAGVVSSLAEENNDASGSGSSGQILRVLENWLNEIPSSAWLRYDTRRQFAPLIENWGRPINQMVYETALGDTFIPYIGTSISYDDNLLRLPALNAQTAQSLRSSQQSAGTTAKSSFIKQLTAGVNMDWKISRQHLVVKANINQNWFDNLSSLDYLGHDVTAQWNWAVGSKLNGHIGYSNTKLMGSYAQLNTYISNIQDYQNYVFDLNYEIIPSWFIYGAATRNMVHYPAATRQISDLNQNKAQFGIQYLSPFYDVVGVMASKAYGKYPNALSSGSSGTTYNENFTLSNYTVNFLWNHSVKTTLDGQLGYTQLIHPYIPASNFGGFTGQGNFNWKITEKTALLISAWRLISLMNTTTSSLVLSNGASLIPSWLVANKIKISIPLYYAVQSYLGNAGGQQAASNSNSGYIANEVDRVSDMGFNVDYYIFDNTELSLFFLYENRRSNNAVRNYKDESLGLNMKFAF